MQIARESPNEMRLNIKLTKLGCHSDGSSYYFVSESVFLELHDHYFCPVIYI